MTATLTERVVLRSEGSISGFDPGTHVIVVEDRGPTLTVTTGAKQFDVSRHQLNLIAPEPPPLGELPPTGQNPPRPGTEHIPLASLGEHLSALLDEIPTINDNDRLTREMNQLSSNDERVLAALQQVEGESMRICERFRAQIDIRADRRHAIDKQAIAECEGRKARAERTRFLLEEQISALEPRAKSHYDLRKKLEAMKAQAAYQRAESMRFDGQLRQMRRLSGTAYSMKSDILQKLEAPEVLSSIKHEYLDKETRETLKLLIANRAQRRQIDQLRIQLTQTMAELRNRTAALDTAGSP